MDRAATAMVAMLERNDVLKSPSRTSYAPQRQHHAVIVGYGRVGSVVGHALTAQGLNFAIVETNQRLVEQLRGQHLDAVVGDAAAAGVLETVGIDTARLLVIASPDGFRARRILEIARQRNPTISVVVRTHSAAELEYLIRQGVDRAVMGELELALEMTNYALLSLGVSQERSKLVTQWLRSEGIGSSFDRNTRHRAPAPGSEGR